MGAVGLVQGAETGSGMSVIGLRRALLAATVVTAELPCAP
jgi:hypothetical protein